LKGAGNPVLVVPKLPDANAYFPFIRKSCLERKSRSSPPQ
jgi:hypothetical protein